MDSSSMPRFHFTNREWPGVIGKILSRAASLPEYGRVDDVGFEFGPPDKGLCSCRMVLNGRPVQLCTLSDTYRNLGAVRSWMERCLTLDRSGRPHPEVLTVDCDRAVLTAMMVHAGWDRDGGREGTQPVSLLILHFDGEDQPFYTGFCLTYETVARLYYGIMETIGKFGDSFDRTPGWFAVEQFRELDAIPYSEVLLETLKSDEIEEKTMFCRRRLPGAG